MSSGTRLKQYYSTVRDNTSFGGAEVLQSLADKALDCVDGTSAAQDAVAFVLATVFSDHAEDRTDRVVSGDDNYLLVASGIEHFTRAVEFVVEGGSSENALAIISQLTQLTSAKLYRR